MPSRFRNVDLQAVESAMTFKISLNNEGMLALYLLFSTFYFLTIIV
jgi:hypothetical protein